jgi:sugar phosphate isomerase/epimerase
MASRIGVCSWSLRPGSIDELEAALERLGLRAVQLALGPLIQERPAWSGAVARLRRRGIDVVSGMMAMAGEDYSTLESIARTGGVRPDETWDENRRRAAEVARLAGAEGIPLVTFHAGFIPEDAAAPERRALRDRIRFLADLLAACGVVAALETGQESAHTLLAMLGEVNHPGLGVNFDPANMILYGSGDPVQALATLRRFVRQVHVKDAVPAHAAGSWGREVRAGTGSVDWEAFFEEAARIERPVDFVIEREAGPNREPDIAIAAEMVRQRLAAVRQSGVEAPAGRRA